MQVIQGDAGPPFAAPTPNEAGALVDGGSDDGGEDSSPPALPAGAYVAPNGDDTAAGSPSAPFKSAAVGLAAAIKANVPLYLCTGNTYAENLVIKSGVSIDGSRDCTQGWAPTTNTASIAPGTGVPITIQAGKAAVAISYVHAIAADDYTAGASVLGLVAIASGNVAINNAEISAGNAGDGQTPSAPAAVTTPAPNGANGETCIPTECSNDLGFCSIVYTGGSSSDGSCYGQGGAGGNGGNQPLGDSPQSGQPGLPAGIGGAGGAAAWIYPGKGAGLPGGPGTEGSAGSPATSGFGSVSSTTYVASNAGTAGSAGGPGGGGGGGAGGYSGTWGDPSLCNEDFLGAGGGQGGYGGCGGQAAAGGGGGGASIAVLSIGSALALTDVILDTASGGRGGNSAPGAAGQPGGQGGLGGTGSVVTAPTTGCLGQPGGNADNGGPGGVGGKGGPSGPGGGGPSIGLVATNVAPTLTTVSFNIGGGGEGGKAITGNDGAPGVTGDTYFIGIADAGSQ